MSFLAKQNSKPDVIITQRHNTYKSKTKDKLIHGEEEKAAWRDYALAGLDDFAVQLIRNDGRRRILFFTPIFSLYGRIGKWADLLIRNTTTTRSFPSHLAFFGSYFLFLFCPETSHFTFLMSLVHVRSWAFAAWQTSVLPLRVIEKKKQTKKKKAFRL
jgi:hypothetical protein